MQGRVIRGIAGFYYVSTEKGTYECKAKGVFRKQKIKIIPGDYVEIEVLSDEDMTGNIQSLQERKNELIRPVVSNVDQALVIFAASDPKPNFNLLDRLLLLMREQQVSVMLCFNKCDLIDEEEKDRLYDIYKDSGCEVFFISSKEKIGLEMLKERLAGKTTVLAGPSGVGKSTTTNLLQNQILMATGEISQKIARGKHTTRHAELIMMGPDTYLVDTPGFSSLWSLDVKREELKDYYPEFMEYNQSCRFLGCVHYKEPNCAIKDMVASGKISQSRYDNYIQILEEISEKEKNKKRY